MKIYVQPRNGDSFEQVLGQAFKILQNAEIPSVLSRATIHDRPALRIDPTDLPEVLEILKQAGIQVIAGNENERQPNIEFPGKGR
jgi:hypothetical protein